MEPVESLNQPALVPLGDNALVCAFAPPASLATQTRVWAVARAARGWPHVVEVVPGMNNLTVVYDPLQADTEALSAQLKAAWSEVAEDGASGNLIEIPVQYGGADGPDLDDVARFCGLSTDEVVARHTAAEYVVFFLGFQPGFAYLGGLDPALHMPRRAEPRIAVPVGSVAIGGEQTGIYPAESPGGWQLIGRTSVALFDPLREQPSLLAPGDRVRFTVAGSRS